MLLPRSTTRLCLHSGLSLLLLSVSVYAQSPTETAINIQNRRWSEVPPPAAVSRASFPSRSSPTRAVVTVRANNPAEARRAAIHYVYRHSASSGSASLKEFEAIKEQLADVNATLKDMKATIHSNQKTAEGYVVDVELAQTTGDIQQDLRRNAYSNFRLVALMPETVDGQRANTPKVETALVGALAGKQFRVYDWNFVSARKPLASLVSATFGNQTEAAVQLGSRFLANVIVVGRVDAKFSQDNGGIISYRAAANLRVIKTDTGQILTAHEYTEKGFGQDKTQAAREALDNLAQKVAKELPDELESHFDEYPVTIHIPLQKPEQADEVETFLRTLAGVKGVERTLTKSGASFRLTSREKPVALAARIQQSHDYRLTSNTTQP